MACVRLVICSSLRASQSMRKPTLDMAISPSPYLILPCICDCALLDRSGCPSRLNGLVPHVFAAGSWLVAANRLHCHSPLESRTLISVRGCMITK